MTDHLKPLFAFSNYYEPEFLEYDNSNKTFEYMVLFKSSFIIELLQNHSLYIESQVIEQMKQKYNGKKRIMTILAKIEKENVSSEGFINRELERLEEQDENWRQESLYEEENDKILQDLRAQFQYMGLDGCRMRNGFHFAYKGMHMTYHKTLPYSTIVETDENGVTYDILYDNLIKQNGELHSDWTGVKLDVEKYRNVVFEPYDLKVLDGTVDF